MNLIKDTARWIWGNKYLRRFLKGASLVTYVTLIFCVAFAAKALENETKSDDGAAITVVFLFLAATSILIGSIIDYFDS